VAALEPTDRFYVRTLEHALAYFGSRVLYPARPAVRGEGECDLARADCEKLVQNAVRGGRAKFDATAQKLGYRLGSELYDAYLGARVARSWLRRLFLTNLMGPGQAKEVCLELARKARSGRGRARSAEAGV
jgi:hypothetical protein